jgi:DNA invertase Pin-like site-specific DNA recombinase
MSNSAPRDVVAYYRVSTELQGTHGLGMAAQREAVRLYGERNGYPIVASYEEVETGRKDDLKNRPALVAAVAHARRSGALLVIAGIDRLARSVFVTSQLLASGVEFIACDNPHANRMTIQILAVMAEHEGRLISERTKAGLAAAKARGIKLGSPHHLDAAARRKGQLAAGVAHHVRAREAYADLVPLIASWCTEGATMTEMARRLNERGHCTQRRMPWSIATVRALLYREALSESYGFPGRAYVSRLTPEDRARGTIAAAATLRARSAIADAPIAGDVVRRYAAGRSCKQIARELNEEGSRRLSGGAWTWSAIRHVLGRAGVQLRAPIPGVPPYVQRLGIVAAVRMRQAKKESFQAKMLPMVNAMRDRGLTYDEIAKRLNRRGHRTARGLLWSNALVWCLVNR